MTPRLQPLCSVARLIHFGPNQSIPHQTTTTTRYKLQNTRAQSQMAANNSVVAVLYQALAPPKYGGVSKPPKPGGYRDSGADVAYTLSKSGTSVLTPRESPDPANQDHWCFPDTEEGILDAVQRGATHLWANTVLFAEHPLQKSAKLTLYESKVKVVGQAPLCVDQFDDKVFLNDALRRYGGLTLPKAWSINGSHAAGNGQDTVMENMDNTLPIIHESDYPIVAKPVRGRGSHGVKICHDAVELKDHVSQLLLESPQVLLEEYLRGEEGTITIMPPSRQPIPGLKPSGRYKRHWALPPVTRFNHVWGIAPYSGKVAVSVNSRAVTTAEMENDPAWMAIMAECETVASLLRTTAPLRIDIRRFGPGERFALFDVNMKPNVTGPGRPGREDQTSLMGLAAEGLGWDYSAFLQYVLGSAWELDQLRDYTSPLSTGRS